MKRILLTFLTLTLFGVSVLASTQQPTKSEHRAMKAAIKAQTAQMVDSLVDSLRFWFVANTAFVNGKRVRENTGMYTGSLSVNRNKVDVSLYPFDALDNTIKCKKITNKKNKTEIELQIRNDYSGNIRTLYLTIFPNANASVSINRGVSGFFSGKIRPIIDGE